MENSPDEEDATCCARATCFSPRLRRKNVDEPLCPRLLPHLTYATLFWLATVLMMLFSSYAILYFYVGEAVLPGGDVFGLLLVVVFAYFLGWSLAYLPCLSLPPVFGMLMAGIIARNAGWYNVREALGSSVSSKIRTFSATFVLLRAGLQLSFGGLRNHPLFMLNLAVVPCTMELLAVAVCCRFALGQPWAWAFLTGSIMACMSPVVPINCMVSLAERGYGEDKEISTLLFAAASIDDIHIVSMYTICFSFIFENDNKPLQWWSHVPKGLRDLTVGTIFGAVLGIFFVFFPHRRHKNVLWYRIGSLVLGSLMCTTSTSKIAITGGGFLATIIMAMVATSGWRILSHPFDIQPFRNAVQIMWHLMQPVLVGVIGAGIEFQNWPLHKFGLYVACIAIGVLVRMIFAYLATIHTNFNTKERLFVALAWISKGTMQAALGPMTLEQALQDGNSKEAEMAIEVYRMSIVAIVFLAPLGSIGIMLSGPRLLNKSTEEQQLRARALSYHKLMSLQPIRESH